MGKCRWRRYHFLHLCRSTVCKHDLYFLFSVYPPQFFLRLKCEWSLCPCSSRLCQSFLDILSFSLPCKTLYPTNIYWKNQVCPHLVSKCEVMFSHVSYLHVPSVLIALSYSCIDYGRLIIWSGIWRYAVSDCVTCQLFEAHSAVVPSKWSSWSGLHIHWWRKKHCFVLLVDCLTELWVTQS